MIFKIMTDKEMQEADEMTLRERVRELSTAISRLTDIVTILRGTHVTLHEISRDLKLIVNGAAVVVLRQIERNTRPKPKKQKRRKTKRRSR